MASFGEGGTLTKAGEINDLSVANHSAADPRFTMKGIALYAFLLGWPAEGKMTIRSPGGGRQVLGGQMREVQMLGTQPHLAWVRSEQGLTITLPTRKPCRNVYVLKITTEGCQ